MVASSARKMDDWRVKKMIRTAIIIGSLTLCLIGCSSKDSSTFLADAVQGGMSEVDLGRLAVEHASDPSVKDFAQKMIEDHSQANTQLKSVARQKGITLPPN